MPTYKCTRCENIEFESYDSLRKHSGRIHKIPSEEFYIEFYLGGVRPLCKCGCGEAVKFYTDRNGGGTKFREYLHGHYVRTTNGFYSPEGAKKSGETRKIRFASGEIVQHNKGKTYEESYGTERAVKLKEGISNNEGRSNKISEALTGRSKSPEHYEQLCKQLIINRRERLTSGKQSKPEFIMQEILESSGIEFEYQFELSGFFYDFSIKDTNIIIEVDGDFWHCNPNSIYAIPKTKEQTKNLQNDIRKNAIAHANGYRLLRFWESDIINNRLQVVTRIIDEIRK